MADVTEEEFRRHNTKAVRLRWMLDCTMGAQGDFERRKEELAIISQKTRAEISDNDVVQSFLEGISQVIFLSFLFLSFICFVVKKTGFLFQRGVLFENFF